MPTHSSALLQPIFVFLEYALDKTERAFHAIPGSAVVVRYIQSSHRNDPGRTLLELLLFIFALWTVFQSRTLFFSGTETILSMAIPAA